MARRIAIALAVLGIVTMSIAGCRGGRSRLGGVAEATIYHPSRVPPNGIFAVAQDSRTEQRHGLGPGTLRDTAEIVVVDPTRVCVRMSLWALREDLHRAD